MARKLGGRAPVGLLIQAAVCLVLALGFNLDAIASIATLAGILVLSVALDYGVTVELTMLQRLLDTTSFTGWRSVVALALPLASD